MSKLVKSDKIYLDYAAGTPINKEVLDSMLPFFRSDYNNASSMHDSGRKSKSIIETSRERVAKYLNAKPSEIIFTGSGTEADNLALIGIARANKFYGNHIIVSSVEHKAILEPAKQLEKEGFEITVLPVDKYGLVDVKKLTELIKKETILVSIMYANNEIGTIQPIDEIGKEIKKVKKDSVYPIFHTDACQAVPFLPIDVEALNVDAMTINSSKIYGPKGIGALYKKESIKIYPVILGGEQEKNLRAGTENIALIHGFAEALEKVVLDREKETKRLKILQKYFIKGLKRKIPSIKLNGHPLKRLPNNIHISIPRIEGESMVLMLDSVGIEVATGSACSTFDLKPSHVLQAIGQDEDIMHGSIRFSMGSDTKMSDIDYVLKVFPRIVKKLIQISPIK